MNNEKIPQTEALLTDEPQVADTSYKKRPVKLKIMDREYTIACRDDERKQLMKAAGYLDKQMRQVAKGGQVLGADRYAVLAALNITNELLQVRGDVKDHSSAQKRISKLCDQLEIAIDNASQVEL